MSERGGGIGDPGQRVIRHENAESELWRVIKTVFWLCVLVIFEVALLCADVVLLGPTGCFVVVVIGLLGLFAWRLRRAVRTRNVRRQQWSQFASRPVVLLRGGRFFRAFESTSIG